MSSSLSNGKRKRTPTTPLLPTGTKQSSGAVEVLASSFNPNPQSSITNTSATDTGSSGRPRHWIKIQPLAPRYPFVDVYFTLNLYLVDKKDTLRTGWSLPIQAELVYETGQPVPNSRVLEVDPDSSPRINTSGSGSITLRIRECSYEHDNRSFRLKFSCPADPATYGIIEPVWTNVVTVIRHRIKIEHQPPSDWYKDEGGRDKSMSIGVALVDGADQFVTDRDLPIKPVLVYEGETEVKNQGILKILNEGPLKIGKDGRAILRCRIDEVSKNHQKQAFCVRVVPDLSMGAAGDISGDISVPVTVRSKRNKKIRLPQKLHALSNVATASASTSQIVGQVAATHPSDPHDLYAPPRAERRTSGYSGLNAYSASQINATLTATDSNSAAPLSISASESFSLSTAVHGVISWCNFVIKELQNIEWQQVGYEYSDRDKTVDYNRPLYRCPGCSVYRDSVQPVNHSATCPIYRAIASFDSTVSKMLTQLVTLANSLSLSASKGASPAHISNGPSNPSASTVSASNQVQSSERITEKEKNRPGSGSSEAPEIGPPPPAAPSFSISTFFQPETKTSTSDPGPNFAALDFTNAGGLFPSGETVPSTLSSVIQPSLFRQTSDLPFAISSFPGTFGVSAPGLLNISVPFPSVRPGTLSPAISGVPPGGASSPVNPDANEHAAGVFGVLVEAGTDVYPAFNRHHDLVGIYRLDTYSGGSMVFSNVLDMYITADKRPALLTRYKMALQRRSGGNDAFPAVITLEDKITVDRLKEDLLHLHYKLSSSAFKSS